MDEQKYSYIQKICHVQKATELRNYLLHRFSLYFFEPRINSTLFWLPFYCVNETRTCIIDALKRGIHPMPVLDACIFATKCSVQIQFSRGEVLVRWTWFFFWFFGKGPCLVQIFLQVTRTTTTAIKSSKCARNWLFFYFPAALFWWRWCRIYSVWRHVLGRIPSRMRAIHIREHGAQSPNVVLIGARLIRFSYILVWRERRREEKTSFLCCSVHIAFVWK